MDENMSPQEVHEWEHGSPKEDWVPKFCPACQNEFELPDDRTECPLCRIPLEDL